MRFLKYGELDLVYRHLDHLISMLEVLPLDIYRTDLLKRGDTVIDLGAGLGDFSVLASRIAGPGGKIIALEPSVDDYELLEMYVERNHCTNVIALNIGVADNPGIKEITFWGRKYSFMADTLKSILTRLEVQRSSRWTSFR